MGVWSCSRRTPIRPWVPPDWHYVEQARVAASAWYTSSGDRTSPATRVQGSRCDPARTGQPAPPPKEGHELVANGNFWSHRSAPMQRRYLGALWVRRRLDLGDGYGIHGTDEPSSIGRSVSHGCVRMLNEDVERLFPMVPVGTSGIYLLMTVRETSHPVAALWQNLPVCDVPRDQRPVAPNPRPSPNRLSGPVKRTLMVDAIREVAELSSTSRTDLLTDPRVEPRWTSCWLRARSHMCSSEDLFPDFIPLIGEVDDVFVLVLALRRLMRNAGRGGTSGSLDGRSARTSDDLNLERRPGRGRLLFPRRIRRRLRTIGRV